MKSNYKVKDFLKKFNGDKWEERLLTGVYFYLLLCFLQ